MAQVCLICNNRLVSSVRNSYNIFEELATSLAFKDDVPTQNSLQSGKKLAEVLSDIIDIPLEENKVHSNVICKKCYKSCLEYEKIHTRLSNLKVEFIENFKNSISNQKCNYDNYSNLLSEKTNILQPTEQKPAIILRKNLVLPASKLQPIPPDLLLKVGKIPGLSKGNIVLPQIKTANASTLNLKVTVGTSVLTQTIKTTTNTNAIMKQSTNNILTLTNSFQEGMDDMTVSQEHTSPKASILNFDVNSLPNNFLSEAVLTQNGDEDNGDDGKSDGDVQENDDDQAMDIDEDCSLSLIPVSTSDQSNLVLEVDGMKVEGLQSLDSTNEDHKYILGKLEILNEGEEEIDEEDEEAHTIVVNSENGSIFRMVSGQKFMYEGNEISLVMADDDQQQDENNELNDEQGDDSNDDTAIELQMAGDEETASAIIAAAQEQGGAFIKVESGEMYRVQTVDQRSPNNLVIKKGDSFQCLLCDAKNDPEKPSVTGDAESMMRHLKRFHDARIYICQFCSAIMRKKVDFTAHLAEHATKLKGGRATHTCDTCGKTFGSRVLLQEHANVHAGLRPHRCQLCHKGFASKYTYQAHVKTHANRPRPFKCNQCDKSFLTQQHLTQHEKTHSGVKDFICNVCNKAFSTQHNLEVHGVVHSGSKPFACAAAACGKAFARRAELRDHMRTHTGERPYPCDICGARFTQRSNLHSHRRATHLDDKRHHCTLCPKRFKRRRLLEYHIKASHTGERPLKCEVCGASFVYPEHYKKHVRIHSGARPYVCEVCGKSFNSPDNRNTHRFVHSDKKPYECVACGAGYMRKQLLLAHMNSSGHLGQTIVINQPRVSNKQLKVPVQTERIEQVTNKFDAIFNTSELDSSVKSVSLAEKATLSLLQESGDPALLTIPPSTSQVCVSDELHGVAVRPLFSPKRGNFTTLAPNHPEDNLDETSQSAILETVSAEQLADQAEIVANDENGGVVRLIQIKLPDGNNGWVALDR